MSDLAPKTSMRPKPRPKSMEARTVSSSKRGDSGPAAGTPNPLTDYMDKERKERREDLQKKVKVTKMNKGTKIETDPEMERTAKALKQYQTRGPISSADRAMAGLVAAAPDFGRAAAAMPKVTLRRDQIAGINEARPDLRKKEKISKRDYQPFTSSMMDEKKKKKENEGANRGGMKVEKKAMGGKARGMGAATKGGSFSKNG
jgi:hypothetical protein